MSWTAENIDDLTGRVAVVTGANSGLGLATAAALASHGAEVIMACRNPARATQASERVAVIAAGPAPSVIPLDLADLESVEAFAAVVAAQHPSLDLLVNNAGVMAIPRMLTNDGFEMQLGINHLGHFALTMRLWPLLTTGPAARVVTVSSIAARTGTIRFDDLQSERSYHPWGAYGQAKLANLLFANELDRRVQDRQLDLISVSAHPGYARTDLVHNGPRATSTRTDRAMFALGSLLVAQSAKAGALPSLYGSTAAGVRGGQYFGPRGPLHLWGLPTRIRGPRAATRRDTAQRLWDISEELTGTRLPDF